VNLLAIETSTPWCSIAVSRGQAVCSRHFEAGQRHAELALDAVDEVLREAGLALGDLQGIVYGEGPGSFTGLRIACGLVQGLALSRSLPVIGIGTLAALAEEAGAPRVVACLDARMGEVYHAAYVRNANDGGLNEASPPGVYRPEAVPPLPSLSTSPAGPWVGCGSGFAVHGAVLAGRYGALLAEVGADVSPSAVAMLRLARARFERGEGRDAACAAPIYLRDKVALKTNERAGKNG
jgi:tRNA threonylcarbamoyladenosine biosynthesis protein TsaB